MKTMEEVHLEMKALEDERDALQVAARPIATGLVSFVRWCRKLYGLGVEHSFDNGDETLRISVEEENGRLTIYVRDEGWSEDCHSLTLNPSCLEDFIEVLRQVAIPLEGVDC